MGYVFDPAAVLCGQYLHWFLCGLATTIAADGGRVADWPWSGNHPDADQDDPVPALRVVRLALRRVPPQRAAAGADLRLVLRHSCSSCRAQHGVWINAHDSEFLFATVALGLGGRRRTSPKTCAVASASIPKTQYEAARSIGFGYLRPMGWVILPQAFRTRGAAPDQPDPAALQEHEPCHGHRRGRADLPHPGGRQLHLQDFRGLRRGHRLYLAISFGIMASDTLPTVGSSSRLR